MSFWTSSFHPPGVAIVGDTHTPVFRSLITVIVLCLASCNHEPRVENFERSVGHLTQTELIRQFGYPQRLKPLKPEGEVWEYEFLSGHSRCVGYRVYFDKELQSQRWEPAACR